MNKYLDKNQNVYLVDYKIKDKHVLQILYEMPKNDDGSPVANSYICLFPIQIKGLNLVKTTVKTLLKYSWIW